MLRPSRHTHPDQTVIHVASLILSSLMRQRIMAYSAVLAYVKKKVTGVESLFLPALNFLFLMGIIAYHPKNDTIEYVRSHDQ